ncbi:DUF6445 family protein [Paraglaciecola sp. 2405UD69-4]|uniref:DUF6445 family protein n=1 Tax=Paraglaciecola sp. 2405UD69-4 TaxID=3391836 RepID=UPI0039C96FBC
MPAPESIIHVNPDATPIIKHIGEEQTPIIIIDDFALDLAGVKSNALESSDFTKVVQGQSMYPGVRVKLPKAYVVDVLTPLQSLLRQTYKVTPSYRMKPCLYVYSLISTQPHELSLLQRMPHFDTVRPFYFAALHYLNDGPYGATAFFRHKPTGFERITAEREQDYYQSAKQFVRDNGEPPQEYFVKSNEHFECYDKVEYKKNRLVLYPGNLLHSILINPNTDIDPNPRTGRLTANIFLEFC